MSELPDILGHTPLRLMAKEASPALIHDFIDKLYEIEYDPMDRRFPYQMLMVEALMQHPETYPLNAEYEQKFIKICQCLAGVCEVTIAALQARAP